MSKDADVESDSPIPRHDLNDVKDDTNIDEPFSGHSSYEIINDKSEHHEEIVSFRSKNREGRFEIHTTLHKTFPPPVYSDAFSEHIKNGGFGLSTEPLGS